MAYKLRSVNTHFWDDSYIVNLDPIEKLLFLYFLTNPLTNLTGVYEISLRRIAFDTGIDKDMIQKIISRFEENKKMYYKEGFIIIVNFIKNQRINPKMQTNIDNTFEELPAGIRQFIDSLSIGYDNLSIPYVYDTINKKEEKGKRKDEKVKSKEEIKTGIPFQTFWDLYDKKVGDRTKIEKKWNNLPEDIQIKSLKHITEYKEAQPDKQYRKNPETYLNQKSWNDEIIRKNGNGTSKSIFETDEFKQRARRIAESIANDPDLK